MIRVVANYEAGGGKFAEAMAWGKESLGIYKRVTGKESTFCTAIGGAIGGVAWIAQYDSMAQLEDTVAKLLADREYITGIGKAGPLFVPGSGHDQIWRHT